MLAHHGVSENEKVDEFAKAVASRSAVGEAVPDDHLSETGLSQLTRAAADARPHTTAERVCAHVRRERRYNPLEEAAISQSGMLSSVNQEVCTSLTLKVTRGRIN